MTRSTVDVDVLIYATQQSSRFHAQAEDFVERLAQGPDLVYLFWPVLMAYLRVSTHPSLFKEPLTSAEAETNVGRMLDFPNVRTVGEQEDFWKRYVDVAKDVRATGNLVPDTHVVALMRQNEVRTIWTHDRDFRKFTGIEVRDPFG